MRVGSTQSNNFEEKRLHKFCRSKVESTKRYALIVYCATTKTNLNKILLAQKRLVRAIFCRNLNDSAFANLHSEIIYTGFEFYFVEIIKEAFQQIRGSSQLFLSHIFFDKTDSCTRSGFKDLVKTSKVRSRLQGKSLENRIKTAYNFFPEIDHISTNIKELSTFQFKQFFRRFSDNYIFENACLHEHLFQLFLRISEF